ESVDPFAVIYAQVDRLRRRFEVALSSLEHRKGPEPRLSLSLLVSQLCDLWWRDRRAGLGQSRSARGLHWPSAISGWPVRFGGCGGAATTPFLDERTRGGSSPNARQDRDRPSRGAGPSGPLGDAGAQIPRYGLVHQLFGSDLEFAEPP